MQNSLNIKRVEQFPTMYEPSSLYIVKGAEAGRVGLYVSNTGGNELYSCLKTSDITEAIQTVLATWVPALTHKAHTLAQPVTVSASGGMTAQITIDWTNNVTAATSAAAPVAGVDEWFGMFVEPLPFVTPRQPMKIPFKNPKDAGNTTNLLFPAMTSFNISGTFITKIDANETGDVFGSRYGTTIIGRVDKNGVITLNVSNINSIPTSEGPAQNYGFSGISIKSESGTATTPAKVWFEFLENYPTSLEGRKIVMMGKTETSITPA